MNIADVLDPSWTLHVRAVKRWNGRRRSPAALHVLNLALQRIFSNLMENAVRYGNGHRLIINCSCDGESLTFQGAGPRARHPGGAS